MHIQIIDTYANDASIKSLKPNDAYMRQWTRLFVVKIIVCHLNGAKPLSESMLEYCLLDHWEQTSVES